MRNIRFKLMAALVAAIFTAMAMPVAFGKIYAQGDLGSYYIPLRYFDAHCLATGNDFAWCPNLFCGYYAHGEGQIGMYHPLHLALYGALPFSLAYMVDGLIWYLFMLIGMYLLLRHGIQRCGYNCPDRLGLPEEESAGTTAAPSRRGLRVRRSRADLGPRKILLSMGLPPKVTPPSTTGWVGRTSS